MWRFRLKPIVNPISPGSLDEFIENRDDELPGRLQLGVTTQRSIRRASRILIVNARSGARRFSRILENRTWSGSKLVGYVDRNGRGRQIAVHPASEPIPVLGPIARLREAIDRSKPTDLIVAGPKNVQHANVGLGSLDRLNLRVHWVVDDEPEPTGGQVANDRATPMRCPLDWSRVAKRSLDFVVALAALVILGPLIALIALLVLLSSGRPVFYTQERVGKGGRPFKIIKFRTMEPNAERESGPIWAANHDNRCTPLGQWLRQSSLDELPQLINILRGNMSLVGPRPERPMFVDRFCQELPHYPLRHSMPVGLTGWAQVHGWRGRTSIRKRLQYDLDYIGRWSFWLDLKILLMTVLHVSIGKVDWGVPRNRRVERETTDALGRDTQPQWPVAPENLPPEYPATPSSDAA